MHKHKLVELRKILEENIIINVYRVPVILVHGVWSNPYSSWEDTGFKQFLQRHGFWVSMVDYFKHSAESFDPNAEQKIGNKL